MKTSSGFYVRSSSLKLRCSVVFQELVQKQLWHLSAGNIKYLRSHSECWAGKSLNLSLIGDLCFRVLQHRERTKRQLRETNETRRGQRTQTEAVWSFRRAGRATVMDTVKLCQQPEQWSTLVIRNTITIHLFLRHITGVFREHLTVFSIRLYTLAYLFSEF